MSRLACLFVCLPSLVSLSLVSSGCSWIFVDAPPERARRGFPVSCTTSNVAPGFDTAFAALQGVRTLVALNASEERYRGAAISRGADVAFGLTFSAMHFASAVWGFSKTKTCRELVGDRPDLSLAPAPGPFPAGTIVVR